MKKSTYAAAINERIIKSPPGSIFVTTDFSDLAPAETSNRTLLRLEKAGELQRILRGVYQQPEYNDFLGEFLSPSPKKSPAQSPGIIIGQSPLQAMQL